MGVLRRIGRELRDTLVMGGLASAGGQREPRTGMPLQTRFVADSVLPLVRDEDEQSGRARSAWSLLGSACLAGAAAVGIAFGGLGAIGLAVAALGLLLAGGVVVVTLKGATRGSAVHLAGAALAALAIALNIVAPPPAPTETLLLVLLLHVAAAVGLVAGRR